MRPYTPLEVLVVRVRKVPDLTVFVWEARCPCVVTPSFPTPRECLVVTPSENHVFTEGVLVGCLLCSILRVGDTTTDETDRQTGAWFRGAQTATDPDDFPGTEKRKNRAKMWLRS